MCILDLCYNNILHINKENSKNELFFDSNIFNDKANNSESHSDFDLSCFYNVGKQLYIEELRNKLVNENFQYTNLKDFEINKNSYEICENIRNKTLNKEKNFNLKKKLLKYNMLKIFLNKTFLNNFLILILISSFGLMINNNLYISTDQYIETQEYIRNCEYNTNKMKLIK